MATYDILIADDHPLFRSALHQAVTLGLGPDVRLVEVASIAELEARLGVRLIQRSTRRFAVTDIGQRTLQHARAMLAEAASVQAALQDAQRAVEGRGRAFLRPSGTEPVVRVTVEADDAALVDATLATLADAVRAAAA